MGRRWFAPALAVLAGCGAARAPAAPPPVVVPRIALQPCAVRGVGRAAFCGRARLPEDRLARAGRTIDLEIVVVPAPEAGPPMPDPVFVLAGGPGQAATDAAADFAETFAGANGARDLVFVDQRGTGRHSPLRCKLAADGDLGTIAGGDLPEDRLRACLAGMDARPDLYTTTVAVDDLDEVASRLGYDRVNLLAVSYGTLVAQQLLRRHPSRVRAVVLDGVAPPDASLVLSFAENAERVLGALLSECARDATCHEAFPDPAGDLDRAMARLRAAPARVSAALPGDVRATATLDTSALAMTVRSLLYSPDTRGLVPALIRAAAEGDYAPLAPLISRTASAIAHEESVGTYLSVTCAEDVAGISPAQAAQATTGTFLGMARLGPVLRACTFWPRGVVPADFHEPVRSDVPALLLSGTLDPATPLDWVDRVRATLPAARSVVVPGGGHGVGEGGCLPGLVARFLDAPAAPLDTSCIAPHKTRFARSLSVADRR